MTMPPPKVCQQIRKFFLMLGSPSENEAATARKKLNKILFEHSLRWNDLPEILAAADAINNSAKARAAPPPVDVPATNVLDLVLRLLELHIAVTPPERMVIALWVLHTYVFDYFPVTPRLALLSPVRGCGKTTLLLLIELLVERPHRTDDVSAAAIYHQLDRSPHTTLLVDEGDNLGLLHNRVLRSVFNSGHRKGGGVTRFVNGWSRKFPTFAPLAVAAIGMLPLPLMHRAAAAINMQRYAPSEAQPEIKPFDDNDPTFPAVREQIHKWRAICSLARDPEMPPSLRNRAADNWRVLLAIADDLRHGEEARAAAVELNRNREDEDPGVIALTNAQTVFATHRIDRMFSEALVEAMAEANDLWLTWCGPNDDRQPRKLTQGDLSRLLKPFGIRPKSIWPLPRRSGDKSKKGYYRADFEAAWARYCPPSGTAAHPNKVIHLAPREPSQDPAQNPPPPAG